MKLPMQIVNCGWVDLIWYTGLGAVFASTCMYIDGRRPCSTQLCRITFLNKSDPRQGESSSRKRRYLCARGVKHIRPIGNRSSPSASSPGELVSVEATHLPLPKVTPDGNQVTRPRLLSNTQECFSPWLRGLLTSLLSPPSTMWL